MCLPLTRAFVGGAKGKQQCALVAPACDAPACRGALSQHVLIRPSALVCPGPQVFAPLEPVWCDMYLEVLRPIVEAPALNPGAEIVVTTKLNMNVLVSPRG